MTSCSRIVAARAAKSGSCCSKFLLADRRGPFGLVRAVTTCSAVQSHGSLEVDEEDSVVMGGCRIVEGRERVRLISLEKQHIQ